MASHSSHTERTASQPREASQHKVKLSTIQRVNPRVRLLRLALPYTIPFLPGQWLDVYIPGLPKAGGFTLTSTPRAAQATSGNEAHFELAIQESPSNPPAAWLWQNEDKILGSDLTVRVGGSFVWPPPSVDASKISRLVLIAGGVGINPLMSILSHLEETKSLPRVVKFLYASKMAKNGLEGVLFFPRLRRLFSSLASEDRALCLHLTGEHGNRPGAGGYQSGGISIGYGRFSQHDVLDALGPKDERDGTVAYVCGPASMTDSLVETVAGAGGMSQDRVLCEKWW